MTQTYQKIIILKSHEVEEPEVQTPIENEMDELLGDLNPRYFEETTPFKEAIERVYSSDINVGSKFNFFSVF